MNRTILFRGKRLDNGEWVIGANYLHAEHIKTKSDVVFIASTGSKGTGDLDDCGNISNIFNCSYFAVDPLTVGQFTGLTDKPGKMVFEGDIVKTEYWGVCEVGFGEHETCEPDYYSSSAYGWFVKNKREGTFSILRETNSCEVVGTIYDK